MKVVYHAPPQALEFDFPVNFRTLIQGLFLQGDSNNTNTQPKEDMPLTPDTAFFRKNNEKSIIVVQWFTPRNNFKIKLVDSILIERGYLHITPKGEQTYIERQETKNPNKVAFELRQVFPDGSDLTDHCTEARFNDLWPHTVGQRIHKRRNFVDNIGEYSLYFDVYEDENDIVFIVLRTYIPEVAKSFVLPECFAGAIRLKEDQMISDAELVLDPEIVHRLYIENHR